MNQPIGSMAEPPWLGFTPFAGSKVNPLFLLLAPSVREHLQILARLSRLLSVAELRRELLAAEDAEQVLAILRDAEESL